MNTQVSLSSFRHLLGNILTAILIMLATTTVAAQSSPAPVRLAIVVAERSASVAGDMLMVELSKRENLQLLERSEIERVWHEQALSAGNRDYLKLGKILGADGLLLLETMKEATNDCLSIQLVAVKPGVLLSSERFVWPIPNLEQWTAGIVAHLNPLLPKLDVLAKDALPISVVNLRSAIQSSQSREVERELTLLAIERLSRERQLFVLERRRMQLITDEKNLNGMDDSAFWDGSYLLDGVVDRNGYTQDTITISARLVPPGNGIPLQIEISGSRTNPAEVINRLAQGVLKALVLNGSRESWNPSDEAEQYYSEARWAFKWGLYLQAQAATESAWALGRRTPETAQFLIRAYVESIPDEPGNGNDVHVLQVPDSSVFPRLDRGLDFAAQNHSVLFRGTNSLSSFKLGLRLLREAFGQIESYYYAAEMRPMHADELLSLRSKTRQLMKVLDGQMETITNVNKWDDPRMTYTKLKWIEAGVAFEHPEDSLRFYRDLLFTGAKAEGLPRIIGWTWPDRQRVPDAMRHLVDDARNNTNKTVQLEGLFLALMLAPDDEQGSFRNAEERLVSAMWENRELLFQDADRATLVERTRTVLGKRTGDDSIYKAFSHEPFASFKHRLRMAFLTSPNNTNVAVLDEFFPNTNVKMETSEQAKELLPLMESVHQSPAFSKRTEYKLSILRNSAGMATAAPESQPILESASVLEAKFIPWGLSQEWLNSGRIPHFNGMIFRDGKLWIRVRYIGSNEGDFGDTFPSSYIAVDPEHGVSEETFFPDQNGYSSRLFEVSRNSLFVEAGGNLFQYKFREKNWTKIPVPMEGASSLVDLNGRLFVGRPDGLLALNPESGNVQVLVSARRTPPANEIDSLWSGGAKIFPLADAKLGALVDENFLVFDPVAECWSIRPLPLKGKNAFYGMAADYFSFAGAQRLFTGPFARRYLIGFWNEGPAESLLMEETGIPVPPPAAEKLLPPLRWDWPKNYPMEYSQIVTDGKKLWALSPRQLGITANNPEPVKFSDGRDATLFCFTPDARGPLSIPVRFPTAGLTNLMIINGRRTSVLDPGNFGYMMIFQRFQQRVGNVAFWLRIPGGLVLGGPRYCGHWFIADAALEERFTRQREPRPTSTNSRASLSIAPQKP